MSHGFRDAGPVPTSGAKEDAEKQLLFSPRAEIFLHLSIPETKGTGYSLNIGAELVDAGNL